MLDGAIRGPLDLVEVGQGWVWGRRPDTQWIAATAIPTADTAAAATAAAAAAAAPGNNTPTSTFTFQP